MRLNCGSAAALAIVMVVLLAQANATRLRTVSAEPAEDVEVALERKESLEARYIVPAAVYTRSPDWVHAFGRGEGEPVNDRIEICGCGFSQYSSATCIFNGIWASVDSHIIDDGHVVCEVPIFPSSYFAVDGLPQNFQLDVVFDNDYDTLIHLEDIRVGPQVNPEDALSAYAGYTTGGNTISIFGTGFLDAGLGNSVTVYFDDAETTGTVDSDTAISVAVPPGRFNQNARIRIYFNGGEFIYFLEVLETYHYGPIADEITTPCVHPRGNQDVTIVGRFFDDPAFTTDYAPTILVSYYDGVVEWQVNVESNTHDDTTITFTAPDTLDLYNYNDDIDAWGIDVSVMIYFQQVMSSGLAGEGAYTIYVSGNEPLTYHYGAFVYYEEGARVNGDPASTPGIPTSYLHQGGGDEVCMKICGANFYNYDQDDQYPDDAVINFILANAGGTTFVDSYCAAKPVLNTDNLVDYACCTTEDLACSSGITRTASKIKVEIITPDGDYASNGLLEYEDDTFANQPTFTVGPVFAETNDRFIIIPAASTDEQLVYTVYANEYQGQLDSDNDDWDDICVTFYDDDYIGDDADYNSGDPICLGDTDQDGTIERSGDTITITLLDSWKFDRTNYLDIDYDDNTANCKIENPNVHWGPLCNSEFYWDDGSYDIYEDVLDGFGLSTEFVSIDGGTQVTITGIGLDQEDTSTLVALCQRSPGFPGSSSRFTANLPSDDSCTVYNLATNLVAGSTTYSFTVPDNDVHQFIWGDQYDVWIYYDDVATTGDYIAKNAPLDYFDTDFDYNGRILCGNLRFGCAVSDIGTCTGPFGSTKNWLYKNANGDFNDDATVVDPLSALSSLPIAGHQLTSSFGFPALAISGGSVSTNAVPTDDNTITLSTQWHKDAFVNTPVHLVCDACNFTDADTAVSVSYGPRITYLVIDEQSIGDSDELDDMWGAQPDPCKPKSSFRIYGWGFELYRGHCGIFDYDSTYECMDLSCTGWVGEVASYIDVYVDGVLVEDSSLRSADPSEGDYYIEGSLPHRPYGTEAVVKLVFGRRCHEESYDMGAYPNRFLVADQHIHYIPLLESYSPSTYFAQAFGATTIFVTGRGFNNFDVSGCFLDNYQMEGEVHSDTEIQCYFISGLSSAEPAKREIIDDHPFAEPPTNWRYDNWGGEFNTYVPFHLEFYSGDKAQLLPIEDKHPIVSTESEHDWKLTADDEFWWGSQCSIGCNSYRFDDDWSTFSVSGIVPQCYQQEKYDEYIGSTEDEFDPHEGGTVSDFPGSTYCVYRYVNLDLQWTDESGNTHLFNILTDADSLESGVFDDLEVPSADELAIDAGVSRSQIPCPLVVTALATFTDALVTNEDQRVIQCLGEFTYGPSVYVYDNEDTFSTGIGILPVGHPQNDNPDEVPEFYGWINDEVTFEIDDFSDEYMGIAQCIWDFGGNNVITSPIQGGTDDGPSDSDGQGLSCVAPSLDTNNDFNMFDEYAILSIRWPSGNNLIACEKTIAYFYYGPGLFYTEHCENTIYAIDQVENATVFVVGPKCCELNGNIFPIFGIDYDEKINYDDLSSESGGVNIFSGRYLVPTVDSLPSLVPMRTLGPLGFHFENLDGDSDTVNTNADCDSAVCRFNTVLGSELNALCYGPILDMEAVNTRYTYSQPNEEESDSAHPHVFDVSFQGLYLDTVETDIDTDDNYYAYFCDKKNGGNTCNLALDVDYDGASNLEVSLENAMYLDITGTDGGDVFRVSCGDPLNEIEFAFEYKDEVYIQKENWQFPTSVATNSPTLFPQTGDNVHLILDHNPKIVYVDVNPYNRLNIFEGDPDSVGSVLHVSEYGNLVIEVTFSNVYDFYQQGDVDSDGTIDSTYNFGFDGIIGLLGDADQTNFVAHTFNEDGFDCQNTDTGAYSERGFSGACLGSVISDITPTGSNGYGTARFVLPPGPFNSQAYLHFLLNPSVNGYTEAETEYHWQPYVTAVSKDWHDGNGHDTIVFQGEGFCGIAQEYGTFEDDDSSSGEYSGDFDVTLSSALSDSAMYLYSSCSVLQDTLVACTTSRAKEPGSYETTLTFKTNACEGFNCNEEGSVIPTPNLNVYGINGEASPTDLSFLGGQKLFVPFHYGQVFDEAYCLVDGVQSLEATWTGSGFLCVTNAHPNGNNEVSRPALVEMRLLRNSPWGSCGDERPYETTTLAAAVDLAFPCFETVGVANNATLQPVATFYRNQLQEMDSTTFYFSGSHLPSEQSNTQYHCVYEYFYGALFITDVNGDVQPLGTTETTSAGVSSSYGSNGETANVVFRCQWDPSAHDIGHDYTHVKVKIGWGSTGSVVTSSDRYCAAALASSDLNAPLAGELQPKKVSFIGGTSIFVPFSGGDYFDEVYCNIDGYEHSAPAVWVGNGFNCISPDFIDDNLDGRPVAVELLMYTDPYCSENCEPTSYHVISASQCVDLDYPCVQQAQVSPRQNEDDDSNATFSAYAVFDKNHLWHVFDGTVRVRGDYVPSDVDIDRMYCVYEFFSTGQLVKNIADGRLTDRTRAVKVDAIEPHYDSNNVADAVYVCSFNYADFGIKDYPYAKVRIGWLSNDGQEVLVNRDRDCFALLSPASALLPALAVIVASLAALLF